MATGTVKSIILRGHSPLHLVLKLIKVEKLFYWDVYELAIFSRFSNFGPKILTTCKDALMSQAHGVQDAYMDVGGTITGRNR